jgi:NAD kinase
MRSVDQKIVIVTRPTQLASLRRKFATRSQAKFQIISAKKRELVRAGAAPAQVEILAEAAFQDVDKAADAYDSSVERIRQDLDAARFEVPIQTIDRDFLPNFVFGPRDVIVTIGQDGLVANTAKYVLGRPIVAVNPDPGRIDGILLPFRADQAREAIRNVLRGTGRFRQITLAQATLADGQKLLAFNELFIGCRSHVSARYRLTIGRRAEPQSSSGLLVSTGAGSTGWLSSVLNMASGVTTTFGGGPGVLRGKAGQPFRLRWEDPKLVYVVREPFISKSSSANLIAGMVEPGQEMVIESEMASDGVIFSDGVESDYLEFNAGAIARVSAASGKALLVIDSLEVPKRRDSQ